MKPKQIIIKLCRDNAFFLTIAALLLTISSFIEASAVLGLAPVIDLLIHPDLKNASNITLKITAWMKQFNLPITIGSMMVLLLSITIIRSLISSISKFIFTKLQSRIVKEIIIETFESFLSAGWPFFVSKNYGILANTFTTETKKIGDALESIANLLSRLLRAIFYIGIAFFISWKLTLIVLFLLGMFLTPFSLLGKLTFKAGENLTAANNEFQGTVLESFGAAKLILGSANQRRSIVNFSKNISSYITSYVQFVLIRTISPLAFEPLGLIIVLSGVYLGIEHFQINISELFILLYAFRMSSVIAIDATNEKNHIQNLAPALQQVYTLKGEAEQMAQFSGDRKFEKLENEIIFKNITFSYPNHGQILKNVSLTISKGNMVAIIGKSGAGKTTLIDILMGFYQVDSGDVLIDGVLIADLDIKSLRKKIGFVPQDPFLFNMSIRENLLWNNEAASEKEIFNACERANANEFLQKLPKGLDTTVGDRGIRLSGGQRQRLALARAILRKPEILILDEATSSLDSHSEQLIQRSIENIAHSATLVVIAHRLSTIKLADSIYVLDNGAIVESGTFDQLMNIKEGLFLKTAQLQGMKQTAVLT
tara:strand:+ start:3481 stop:5268 length:1788 start_codon:yes stop_codon:yes gene_type:complete